MDLESDYVKTVALKVEDIVVNGPKEDRGGILAFFADAGQAERAQRILEAKGSRLLNLAKMYQLHGRIMLEDQKKVFKHDSGKPY
jgi:HrpA-like RNA helicase